MQGERERGGVNGNFHLFRQAMRSLYGSGLCILYSSGLRLYLDLSQAELSVLHDRGESSVPLLRIRHRLVSFPDSAVDKFPDRLERVHGRLNETSCYRLILI